MGASLVFCGLMRGGNILVIKGLVVGEGGWDFLGLAKSAESSAFQSKGGTRDRGNQAKGDWKKAC